MFWWGLRGVSENNEQANHSFWEDNQGSRFPLFIQNMLDYCYLFVFFKLPWKKEIVD